jgi:hypothetical protein
MGWHLKWIDMLTSKIFLKIEYKIVESNWKFHFAPAIVKGMCGGFIYIYIMTFNGIKCTKKYCIEIMVMTCIPNKYA